MKRCVRTISSLLNKKEKNVSKRLFTAALVQTRPCLQIEWQISKEAVFPQQKRNHASKINQEKCWNCKKENYGDFEMHCSQCGFLQDVKTDISYFQLFDFPQKFDLDVQDLTKRFRKMQTLVHPDKFSNKSSREQSNSDDWSSLINRAYKTLLIPFERGQYLLELNGMQMPKDNSALDKDFLMEMMERNEEVEDAATKTELYGINDRLERELREKILLLGKFFTENNLEKVKTILIEMKYLISIQKSVKNKLQTLLGL